MDTSAFNMSDSETKLLKFELGISNDLASLLYLPLVIGDNNFICRSSARRGNEATLYLLSIQQYNIIFY
jgi:hypothetical protein